MTGKPRRGRKFSSIEDASERRMRIGGLRVIVLGSCLHGFAVGCCDCCQHASFEFVLCTRVL